MIKESFWHKKRVFLTGHTGFKGAWLALALNKLGAHVTGYALEPSSPSLYIVAQGESNLDSHIANIQDLEHLKHAVKSAKPDLVFHLAAQALVRHARLDPVDTFATNVMGTVNVLEAIRACPSVQAAIIVTSDKVYNNVEWAWPYRENDPLGGKEPYGASKAACEMAVQAWVNAYFQKGPKLATVRAGNIIGGGDWAQDRLIPDAMRAFSSGHPLVIRNPKAIRPWQHVLEPVKGYMLLAQKLCEPEFKIESLNFGPAATDTWEVEKIANVLASLWGEGVTWQQDPHEQPYEARFLNVDSSLAHQNIGFSPRWTLHHALFKTVEWYRFFYQGRNMTHLTHQQIEEHLFD